jgi:hypothetical protein
MTRGQQRSAQFQLPDSANIVHTNSTRHRQASQLGRGSTLRASRLTSGDDSSAALELAEVQGLRIVNSLWPLSVTLWACDLTQA